MTKDEALRLALEALETNNEAWKSLADSGDAGWWEAEDQPFFEISVKAITAIREALTEESSGTEQPVSEADELPNGFVPLQKENGKLVYAACMDSSASHYKWLMWRHPDGQWVSKRKLEDWEVMQVEDQEHYGIVQEAAHGIKD